MSVKSCCWVAYFDYTSNRTVAAEAPLKEPATLSVAEAGDQPLPTREEFEAAVEVVAEDRRLGRGVREDRLRPYETMPPLVLSELPDGRVERVIKSAYCRGAGAGRATRSSA
jgi:hypothetical protein